MEEQRKQDRTGAYDWEALVEDVKRPPEEYENPAGISRGDCDEADAAGQGSACHFEVTAQVEDLFMEETKPGFGIAGFEGEEDGGG